MPAECVPMPSNPQKDPYGLEAGTDPAKMCASGGFWPSVKAVLPPINRSGVMHLDRPVTSTDCLPADREVLPPIGHTGHAAIYQC